MISLFFGIAGAATGTVPPVGPESWRLGEVELAPCEIPFVEEPVWCGTRSVWEDREARSGRRIDLRIAVLRATSRDPRPDPIFVFAGGPGGGASEMAPYLVEDLAAARGRRHIVMVDRRGTGASNPLTCPRVTGTEGLQRYFEPRGPEAVRECRERLEQRADLTLYTTPIAMDDLDEVRDAMGFERINLWGGSYGSREALVYVRRHEPHVRSVHIWAVIPPHRSAFDIAPRAAQLSVDRLFDDCAADAACGAEYPELRRDFSEVFERLAGGRVRFTNTDARLGASEEIAITRDQIATTLRFGSLSPSGGSVIPSWIEAAHRGEFTPIGERALLQRRLPAGARGLYYSVICAEEADRVNPDTLARNSAASYWGRDWVDATLEACANWPLGQLPPGFFQPVRSGVPVLVMHGWLDPVTPPAWAVQLGRDLPNARVLVIRDGHHNFEYGDCGNRIVAEFYERLDPHNLDASCVGEIARPPFEVGGRDAGAPPVGAAAPEDEGP